jgi:hypothetical protein
MNSGKKQNGWHRAQVLNHSPLRVHSKQKRELEFVKAFIQLPYDYPLDRRQSQLIERLWNKYVYLHHNELAKPRWIEDYTRERWTVADSDLDYVSSEIGRFSDVRYGLIDPYNCNPENDKFTITFQDGDLW